MGTQNRDKTTVQVVAKFRMQRSMPKDLSCLVFLFLLLACIPWSWSQAATPVTDDIVVDTIWQASESPYVVSGDVRITGGAILTIEPGVRVLFEAQASLQLREGALSAQGTSVTPIVFTSIRDTDQGTPMPGDWGVLAFQSGTLDDGTLLSHVHVRYGQGIVIEEASPVFRDVRIEHSAGPAIQIDLASSPVGHGLEAVGNEINGILVPAGEIGSDVTWALRGIPYVLEQGVLHVGSRGFALSPSRLQLAAGVVGMLELTIPEPAPATGLVVDLVSSVPSVATVPPTVTVAAGERSTQIEVQAHVTGSTIISASAPVFGTTTSSLNVIDPPVLSLTPSRTVISRERGGQIIVALPTPAPAGGRVIALETQPDGVIEVPATVIVPAGSNSAVIDVAGLVLGKAILTASTQDHVSATAQITVRPVSLNPPANVLVAPGMTYSMPILLTDPAPAAGLTISIENDNAAAVQVPQTVEVPAGASSINVDVQGVAIGTAQIIATAPGYDSGTSQVQVESVTIQLQPDGSINLPQGLEAARFVRISHPAPVGGVWVSAQTDDMAIAQVEPNSLFIPEGQIQTSTPVVLKGMAEGSTMLQLQAPGLAQTQVEVNIGPPIRLEFSRNTMVLGKGLMTGGSEVLIECKSGGMRCVLDMPLSINLSSAQPDRLGVPDAAIIPAGAYQASFSMTGLDLTDQPVAVNASTGTGISTQTPLMVDVVMPQLIFHDLDGRRGVGGAPDNFRLMWHVPGAPAGVYQLAAWDHSLLMSIASASPEGLVPGFLDSNGNSIDRIVIAKGHSGSFSSNGWRHHYVATPNATGTYRVAASLEGVGEWTSDVQTVAAATLEFSRASTVVGHGLRSGANDLYVELRVDGQLAPTAEPLLVNLTSSDPDKVGVPATVTIPAGHSRALIPVTGMNVTANPVAISASAGGYGSTQTPAMVTVVTPQLRFMMLDGTRGIGSAPDNFYLHWHVPGAYWPREQVAAQDQIIEMSITSAVPNGLVSGFQDGDGNPVIQIMISEGHNDSRASNSYQFHYVNSPVAAGTYKVAAQLSGVGEWVSDIQTVAGAQLVFSRAEAVVGYGLATNSSSHEIRLMVNGQSAPTNVPVTVALSSANPNKVGVPDTVTIPAGRYGAYFSVSGLELTDEPVAITASTAEHGSTATPLMARVVVPQLQLRNLDGVRGVGGIPDSFDVRWYVQGAAHPDLQTALSDQIFTVKIEDADPVGLISGFIDYQGNATEQVKIAQGQSWSGWDTIYVATPVMVGNYKVSVSLPGVGSWVSGNQSVLMPELRFSKGSAVVGKGLNISSREVQLQRMVGGRAFFGANAVSVSLSCASVLVCSAPSSLTIPAGSHAASLIIQGVGLGATQVNASAQGYVSAPPLDVTTVLPRLVFRHLPERISVGDSKNFTVGLQVPGATYWDDQRAAAPLRIDLTSAQPAVATVPAELIIDVGGSSAWSSVMGVGTGTTTITASGDDLVPVTSGMITVQQP